MTSPAATEAPSGTAATVFEAAGEPAAEEPGGQAQLRTVERILLLADLNRVCSELGAAAAEFAGNPEDLEALTRISDETDEISKLIDEFNDPALVPIRDRIVVLRFAEIALLIEEDPDGESLSVLRSELEIFGNLLGEYGAIDCLNLWTDLP